MISEIAENIDVVAQFGRKGFQPRIFVWEKRRHTVSKVTVTWTSPNGASCLYHFAVQTDGANTYELCFDQAKLT